MKKLRDQNIATGTKENDITDLDEKLELKEMEKLRDESNDNDFV